jgi:prepilin-type N-terminal cleavage/methylation domain-containing protein
MWAKDKKIFKHQPGFTIVELLIVVVVIAILATITLVTYNGIQQRARNSQTLSAVNAYLKGIAQYTVLNHSYPPTTQNYNCLGENNPGDYCWKRTGTPPSSDAMVENATFNAALKTVMGSLPDVNPTIVGGRNGIMFVNHSNSGVTLDGVTHGTYLMYIMEGTGTACTAGSPLLSGNWATFSSTPPASGHTVSLSGGTECWIGLPTASEL